MLQCDAIPPLLPVLFSFRCPYRSQRNVPFFIPKTGDLWLCHAVRSLYDIALLSVFHASDVILSVFFSPSVSSFSHHGFCCNIFLHCGCQDSFPFLVATMIFNHFINGIKYLRINTNVKGKLISNDCHELAVLLRV